MANKDIYDDISSIKTIMERSAKFISLSGLSGIMAGIYALVGAWIAYSIMPAHLERKLFDRSSDLPDVSAFHSRESLTIFLFSVAIIVLILSVGTGLWLTVRKAKQRRQTVWNPSSRALLKNGLVPLLTGGCFIIIILSKHHYGIIAPACLIFYGLSLAAASQYTFGDVKWLGVSEIMLGLVALLLPGYGLLFWALGFGVLHILYGTIMYFKYDRGHSAA